MADETLGFRFRGRKSGAFPTIQDLTFKDTETLTKGDMVNLETGEVDLLATADTAAVGMVQETLSGTDSTTAIKVIIDVDAIYGVFDENARVIGATLDVAGATGNQTIASSSNKNFVVFADSAADEETLVIWNVGKHFQNVAL